MWGGDGSGNADLEERKPSESEGKEEEEKEEAGRVATVFLTEPIERAEDNGATEKQPEEEAEEEGEEKQSLLVDALEGAGDSDRGPEGGLEQGGAGEADSAGTESARTMKNLARTVMVVGGVGVCPKMNTMQKQVR